MSSILQITIPHKPLTTNHIYGRTRFGKTYLKEEAKNFKEMVKGIMNGSKLNYDPKKHYISLETYFYLSRFYTNSGSINLKAGDIDNFKKILIDAIFESLCINDAYICDGFDRKRYGLEDKTIVIVKVERREALDHVL